METIFALLSMGAGLALVFTGYRLARIIIPLWGFVTGLAFGGTIAAELSDAPLLGATLGIITGLLMGFVLAGLAYFFYAAAVIILFGAVGYWIGSGLVLTFGANLELLAALIGVGMGLAGGVAAVMFKAPKYVLIAATAFIGAVGTMIGILILTSQIPFDEAGYGAVHLIIDTSQTWTFATLCLAAAGFISQTLSTEGYQLKHWSVGPKSSTTTMSSMGAYKTTWRR